MESKDIAYLEWLEPDFSEFDKIPAQERRKVRVRHALFELTYGLGFGGLACALALAICWLHNTGVALR